MYVLVYVNFWISDNDLSKRQKKQFFLFSKNALKYTKKKDYTCLFISE